MGDAAHAVVSYIRHIDSDVRFAKELVTWLSEERRQRHRERANSTKRPIIYKVNDMVMAHVQVQSDKDKQVVGKLSIEARGPYRIVEDHGNGSYSVQQFDKPDVVIRKFMGQNLYALPPQILPCDDIDLPDFCYLNSDFAPVKHPFADSFNIENYNNMWLDDQNVVTKPDLRQVCEDDIIDSTPDQSTPKPLIGTPITTVASPTRIPPTPRPDTIDEIDAYLPRNDFTSLADTCTAITPPLPTIQSLSNSARHQAFICSKDKLCFISFRGANTICPRWYLVQIRLDGDEQSQVKQYLVDFFRKHPTDAPKR